MKRFVLLHLFAFFSTIAYAQVTWTGGGGNSDWHTGANWSSGLVPDASTDVLLNNSTVTGSYPVQVNSTAAVRTLTITPTLPNNITLLIPITNLDPVSLQTFGTGIGSAIILNSGAIFQNQSGVTSGTNIVLSDSIRVNNGGRYTHATRAMNSPIVNKLAFGPGTERGVFRYANYPLLSPTPGRGQE
ncbi:MAG: hypothetical protein EOO88_45080 [Pedobacter sp.]|nr:MAG: hypothetical protein EOO88_45080 [Pedobacter sp.]